MAETKDHIHVKQVVQKSAPADLMKAAQEFNVIDRDGRIALVLVPKTRWCCDPTLRIPTGSSAIVQRWGADAGEWTPGLHFVPYWYRVVYLVTKQSCTYYYSVTNCPTKDNVMVKVEVTLVFSVLKATQFVYSIGATKFDDALKAVAEEAIRGNVRQIMHQHIYELRGSGAAELLKCLNAKFDSFGVLFSNATIVNVALPVDLAAALENATTFDAKMRQQIRSQEFNLKVLNDENDKQLKDLFLRNERALAQEQAKRDRILIEMETRQATSERERQNAVVKAQQDVSVMKTHAKAALETETLNVRSEMELLTKRQEGESLGQKIEAEQHATSMKLRSEAGLQEAVNKAKAITLEAEAEAKVYDQLAQKREFDVQHGSLKALQHLAGRGKIVISGDSGKNLVESMATPLLKRTPAKK